MIANCVLVHVRCVEVCVWVCVGVLFVSKTNRAAMTTDHAVLGAASGAGKCKKRQNVLELCRLLIS